MGGQVAADSGGRLPGRWFSTAGTVKNGAQQQGWELLLAILRDIAERGSAEADSHSVGMEVGTAIAALGQVFFKSFELRAPQLVEHIAHQELI